MEKRGQLFVAIICVALLVNAVVEREIIGILLMAVLAYAFYCGMRHTGTLVIIVAALAPLNAFAMIWFRGLYESILGDMGDVNVTFHTVRGVVLIGVAAFTAYCVYFNEGVREHLGVRRE